MPRSVGSRVCVSCLRSKKDENHAYNSQKISEKTSLTQNSSSLGEAISRRSGDSHLVCASRKIYLRSSATSARVLGLATRALSPTDYAWIFQERRDAGRRGDCAGPRHRLRGAPKSFSLELRRVGGIIVEFFTDFMPLMSFHVFWRFFVFFAFCSRFL